LLAYISIQAAQRVIGGFDFGDNYPQTLILVMVALVLLNIFMIPLFRILSLPHFGVGFLFLNFVLTLVILYILTMFLPGFGIVETKLAQLSIFGFVLPSKELTVFWSAVYSALVLSLAYHFIEWLFDKR
jgi:uncharacterized membrane protein YvlD (DUF360 family)